MNLTGDPAVQILCWDAAQRNTIIYTRIPSQHAPERMMSNKRALLALASHARRL